MLLEDKIGNIKIMAILENKSYKDVNYIPKPRIKKEIGWTFQFWTCADYT